MKVELIRKLSLEEIQNVDKKEYYRLVLSDRSDGGK